MIECRYRRNPTKKHAVCAYVSDIAGSGHVVHVSACEQCWDRQQKGERVADIRRPVVAQIMGAELARKIIAQRTPAAPVRPPPQPERKAGFGICDEETIRARMDICSKCPERSEYEWRGERRLRCRACGCFMHIKTRLSAFDCPRGKWQALSQPQGMRETGLVKLSAAVAKIRDHLRRKRGGSSATKAATKG